MKKIETITVGAAGALAFLASSLRPSLAADLVRFARWQHRWH
jgi:hypothetical protein